MLDRCPDDTGQLDAINYVPVAHIENTDQKLSAADFANNLLDFVLESMLSNNKARSELRWS